MKLSWRILYAAGQATVPHLNNEIFGALSLVQMLMDEVTAPFRKPEKTLHDRPV